MVSPVGRDVGQRARRVVAAVGGEGDRRDDAHLNQRLQWRLHGRPPRPSTEMATDVGLRRQLLLVAQIAHEDVAARMGEAEIVDAQHAHAEAHLGADGIQLRIERFFGDREVGQPHRHHAALAPDEQRQRLLQRNDLQRARVGHVVVGDQRLDGRIDEHLELRQLRMQAELRGDGELIRELQLVGGVELGFDLDGFDGRSAQAQRIDAGAVLCPLAPPGSAACGSASPGCTAAR